MRTPSEFDCDHGLRLSFLPLGKANLPRPARFTMAAMRREGVVVDFGSGVAVRAVEPLGRGRLCRVRLRQAV